MDWATFSCKRASEMIEKRLVTKLTSIEKIKLTIHLSMCKTCQAYENESEIIEKIISSNSNFGGGQKKIDLPADFKAKIISKLSRKDK